MLNAWIERRELDRLLQLARTLPSGLAGSHRRLLDAGVLAPGVLYRDADPAVRDLLLDRLRKLDGASPARRSPEAFLVDKVLVALAWIGDAVVQLVFDEWRRHRPSWDTAIYIAPHEYATQAGWTLTAGGGRRDLYVPRGRSIVRSDRAGGPLQVLAGCDERCRYCSHPLGVLFDLDVAGSELPFPGKRLLIPFCHDCSCGDRIYFRSDDRGAHWHENNEASAPVRCEFNPWDEGPLVLGPALATPFEYQGWHPSDLGHLGGFPGWIDDAYHPECLDCSQPSLFVGQLEVASGGRFYAFLCESCHVVTTTYQQT
jgi:hypothetical protein